MTGSFVEAMAGQAKPLGASIQTPGSFVEKAAAGQVGPSGASGVPDYNAPESPDNPFVYAGGLLVNTLRHGIPNLVKGITDLAGIAVHDVGGAVLQAIPGEQGGWERQIEEQGYQSDDIVRALPQMLLEDYTGRYGLQGFEEMKNRLYDDPLAYILDFVGAGAVASKGSKVGHVLGLLDDATVTKIRGIAPELERARQAAGLMGGRPVMEVGSMLPTGRGVAEMLDEGADLAKLGLSTGAAPTTGIGTSFNPTLRWMKEYTVNKFLTKSADELANLAEDQKALALGLGSNPSAVVKKTIDANLAEYARQGQRVLTPTAEKFFQGKVAKHLLGLTQDKFYHERNLLLNWIRTKYEEVQAAHPGVTDINLIETIQGSRIPLPGARAIDNFEVDLGGIQPLQSVDPLSGRPTITPPSIGEHNVGDYDTYNIIRQTVGDVKTAEGHVRVLPARTGTPWRPEPNNRQLAYDVPTLLMTDAPNLAKRIADALGMEVKGVVDTLSEPGHGLKGHSYMLHGPDGRVVELNIGTPDLLRAQRIVWDIQKRVPEMEQVLTQTEAMLQALTGEGDLKAAKAADVAISNLAEEVEAARLYAQHAWNYPLRSMEGYLDGGQEFADFARNWEYEAGMRTWLDEYGGGKDMWSGEHGWVKNGMKGPFTEALNRAYGPMRLRLWGNIREEVLKPQVVDIYKTAKSDNELKIRLGLLLEKHGLTESEQGLESLGRTFGEGTLGKDGRPIGTWLNTRRPERAAEVFMEKLRRGYRQAIVSEGSMPGWDWKTMNSLGPSGALPGYFPHIRKASVRWSDYGDKTRHMRDINTSEPAFSKGWRGYLLEKGQFLDDVNEAYGRVAAAYARHREVMDLVDQIKQKFGRELDASELELIKRYKMTTGEVLWSPDALKRHLGLHSEILDEIFEGIHNGKTYEQSAIDAVRIYEDKIAEAQLMNFQGAKIYAIPKAVADKVERQVRSSFAPGAIQFFWDNPMNFWRSMVLGMNPRWLVYNEFGNIIFTGIKHPAALPRIFSQLRKGKRAAAETILGEEVGGDIIRSGYVGKEEQLMAAKHRVPDDAPYAGIAQASYKVSEKVKNSWLGIAYDWWTGKIFNANTIVEQAARRGVAIDATLKNYILENGKQLNSFQRMFMSDHEAMKLISGKGVTKPLHDEIIEGVNRTLGNYTDLSAFERQVLRRFFIPFYPFYRHVTKFVLRLPFDHPLKAETFRLIEQIDEELSPEMPDWLEGASYLGQLGSKDAWLRVQNINPLDYFSNPRGQLQNLLGPIPNMLIQANSGRDALGRPFTNEDVFQAANGMRFIRTENGWEPFEGEVHPPWAQMAAMQIPLLQIPGMPTRYNEFGKGQTWQTSLASMAGLPITRYDVDQWRLNSLLGEIQALQTPQT